MKKLSHVNNRDIKCNIANKDLKQAVKNAISPSFIGKQAKKHGFVRRRTSFKATSFFEAIILAAGDSSPLTLAGINSLYSTLSGKTMHHEAFHDRIKDPRALQVMSDCLGFISNKAYGIQHVHSIGKRLIEAVNAHGVIVDDIELVDGTYWNIDNKFADMFKGARTSQKAEELPNTYEIDGTVSTEKKPFAQLGLQTCYSCKKGIFTKVDVTSGIANEKDYVEVNPEKSVLKIFDAGYYKLELLNEIDTKGSYFMIRGKGNMVGEITDCYFYGKRQEAFIGKNLRDPMVRNYKKHEVLDLDVTLKNGLKVRVLRVWSKKDKKISFLVTNILRNQMKYKIVTKIQKVRWQIELLFKEMKGGVNLRGVHTKNFYILMIILQACLIAAFIKYMIYLSLDMISSKQISPLKVFKNSINWWRAVCLAILRRDFEKLQIELEELIRNKLYYEKSKVSKSREKDFKSLNAVLNLLEQSAQERGFAEVSI